ncbi:MAG: ParB N-terminal domain-containing protein [bacterium]
MRYRQIRLEEVLLAGPKAQRFVFTFRPDLTELVSWLSRAGLLVPPLLRELKEGGGGPPYQVVCGWRRIQALRMLGTESFEALVADSNELNDGAALSRSLLENLFHRGFNEVEKALICTRIHDEFPGLVSSTNEALRGRLTIPGSPGALHPYRFLLSLPPAILSRLAEGGITVGQALLLKELPEAAREPVSSLMEGLGFNLQESRQAVEWILEICRRDGREPLGFIEALTAEALQGADIPPSRRSAQRFLAALRSERFPHLDSWTRRREKVIEGTGLGREGVQVSVDPTFETSRIRIQVSADSEKQLQDRIEALHRAAREGKLEEIFRLL